MLTPTVTEVRRFSAHAPMSLPQLGRLEMTRSSQVGFLSSPVHAERIERWSRSERAGLRVTPRPAPR